MAKYECTECGKMVKENKGQDLQTFGGSYYDPPEYEFFCNKCVVKFEAAEEAWLEGIAEQRKYGL